MFFFGQTGWLDQLPEKKREFFEADRFTLKNIEFFLSFCRAARSDITVGTLAAFVFIARQTMRSKSSGPTIKELAEELGVSHATATRFCEVLGSGPIGRSGLGWVEKIPGEDARTRHIVLTHSGISFLSSTVDGMPLD